MSNSSLNRLNHINVPRSSCHMGPFGRMFSKLPPWVPPGKTDEEKEKNIREFAAEQMFTPKGEEEATKDNPKIPAGYTYFGQFIDHDITFDPTSSLQRQNDPNMLQNFRTPQLDLDCLYGEGPDDEPFMYDHKENIQSDGYKGFLLVGRGLGDGEDDLPRNIQGTALIGDHRNDENVIVSQLQLAFIKFHNNVLAALEKSNNEKIKCMNGKGRFELAQRLVRWTYQYVVWNDFIARLIHDDLHKNLLSRKQLAGSKGMGILDYGGEFYKWKVSPYMPVEFSVAAYRMGHSMVRPGYQVNLAQPPFGFGADKEVPILGITGAPVNLGGFQPLKEKHTLQWDWFLDLPGLSGGPFPQSSQKLDMLLPRGLFEIPDGNGNTNPLATLNILRNWRLEVPSGKDIAILMGVEPINVSPMEECLWVYILKEATAANKGANSGTMLGPVGGCIVGEVFAGLLHGDSSSYVRCNPSWTPNEVAELLDHNGGKPVHGDKGWQLADIIFMAGVQDVPFDGDGNRL